jgi:hypothetical protein
VGWGMRRGGGGITRDRSFSPSPRRESGGGNKVRCGNAGWVCDFCRAVVLGCVVGGGEGCEEGVVSGLRGEGGLGMRSR